jgi:hypothetical protein
MEEVLNGNGSPAITESRSILSVAWTSRYGEYGGISGGSWWEEGGLVDCAGVML